MIIGSLSIRGLGRWFLFALLLFSSLARVGPVEGQDLTTAFPSGVEVIASLESPVSQPSESGLSLRLSHLSLDPSQVIDNTSVADPLLVFIDFGSLTVVMRNGIEKTYPSGSQLVIQPNLLFSVRNDSADPVSMVVLGLEAVSDSGDTSLPIPLLAGSQTDFTTRVDPALFPARLLLARLSWEPGADSGTHTFSGPVGILIESGSLAVTGSTGDERLLEPGHRVVFRAGTPNRQRNTGSDSAVVLVASIVPEGTTLFQPVTANGEQGAATPGATAPETPTTTPGPSSKQSVCDDRFASEPFTIRDSGKKVPYQVWVSWSPELVVGKNCRAWIFFSAQAVHPDQSLGTKKLYSARFDPDAGKWRAATPFPGGQIQFGPSAVIDKKGTAHLVYSDRADDGVYSYGQLMYVKSTASGGWTDPIAVAPDGQAGHQISPELLIDKKGALHVVWQDQRSVDQVSREAAVSNADVFSSDLGADGAWSAPVQLSARPDATTNASRPQLGTDGDRLVAVWSIYTADSGLDTAARLEWSTRPINGSAGWSKPYVLLQRGDTQIGGRLLDLASNPDGGAALVYGSRTGINTLYARRLSRGAATWDAPIQLIKGNRGSFPSAAFTPEGTLVVVYNEGDGNYVDVGMVTLLAGATESEPTMTLTSDEAGSKGRAVVTIDGDGDPWVAYFHESIGGTADSVWCQRNVQLVSTY